MQHNLRPSFSLAAMDSLSQETSELGGPGNMLKTLDPILITIIAMSALGVFLGAICGVVLYCACSQGSMTDRNLSALENYNFELVDGVKLKKDKMNGQTNYSEAWGGKRDGARDCSAWTCDAANQVGGTRGGWSHQWDGRVGWKWANVIFFLRSGSGRDWPVGGTVYKESVQQKKKKKRRRKSRILFVFRRDLLISCNHMLVLRPIQMKVSFVYFYGKIGVFGCFSCLFFRCHSFTERVECVKFAILISGSLAGHTCPCESECVWKCVCVYKCHIHIQCICI